MALLALEQDNWLMKGGMNMCDEPELLDVEIGGYPGSMPFDSDSVEAIRGLSDGESITVEGKPVYRDGDTIYINDGGKTYSVK